MKLIATPYILTSTDTQRIQQLGYTITTTGSISLEDFINTEFPNFNFLSILEQVERDFTPLTAFSINREIVYNRNPAYLGIFYQNQFIKDEDDLCFIRQFSKSGSSISITHSYCILPEIHQGKGLIQNVFQESLRQYINMGADRILVHCGLSTGGLAWAKYGFVGVSRPEMQQILDDARTILNTNELVPIERIFNLYYANNPGGKAFPIQLWAALDSMKKVLLGADWHGEIDLKNNEQLSNFTDYVFRS